MGLLYDDRMARPYHLHVPLPDDLHRRLVDVAEAERRSLANVARLAIEKYLNSR